MDLVELIAKRRSIRKFENREVEEGKIAKLIDFARLCQSAKNRQPWRFMILKGEDKNSIADIMLSIFEKKIDLPKVANSSKAGAKIIRNAPVLIMVFREQNDQDLNWFTGDMLSIGAAIEHICLGSVELGLGSVWIRDTVYADELIINHLQLKGYELVSSIAVGYASETPIPRPRKAIDEIIINPCDRAGGLKD